MGSRVVVVVVAVAVAVVVVVAVRRVPAACLRGVPGVVVVVGA